jgi:hypothetical protein
MTASIYRAEVPGGWLYAVTDENATSVALEAR